MLFRSLLLGLALVASGVCAGTARADGLPVSGIDVGNTGVTTARVRYVTLPLHDNTLLAQVERDGGTVFKETRAPRPLHHPGCRTRRVCRRPFRGWTGPRSHQAAHRVPEDRDGLRHYRDAAAARAGVRDAARGLQLRRALARRIAPLPDQVPLAARPDAVRSQGLRRECRAAPSRPGRRPERERRRDAGVPADPGRELRRALGLHALRRWGKGALRPRTGHSRSDYSLYRPGPLSSLIRGDMSQLRMRLREGTLVIDAGGSPLVRIDTGTFAVHEPAAASAVTRTASPEPIVAAGGSRC